MNGATTQIVFLLLIMGAMWFILIRPQQQRTKQHAALVAKLEVGAVVVTVGGLVGRIVELHDDTVVLESADSSRVEFVRDAVGRVLESAEEPHDASTGETEPPLSSADTE
jgi:preprotein translocase subunit YajC